MEGEGEKNCGSAVATPEGRIRVRRGVEKEDGGRCAAGVDCEEEKQTSGSAMG